MFEALVLYALCSIQSPAGVLIPEGLCLFIHETNLPRRVQLRLRPLKVFKPEATFPSFVLLDHDASRKPDMYQWAEGAITERSRLSNQVLALEAAGTNGSNLRLLDGAP